jgi:hypothetical protein
VSRDSTLLAGGVGGDRVAESRPGEAKPEVCSPATFFRSDSTRAATCRLSSGDSSSMLAISRSRSWPEAGLGSATVSS